jgi:hypothetical protein
VATCGDWAVVVGSVVRDAMKKLNNSLPDIIKKQRLLSH